MFHFFFSFDKNDLFVYLKKSCISRSLKSDVGLYDCFCYVVIFLFFFLKEGIGDYKVSYYYGKGLSGDWSLDSPFGGTFNLKSLSSETSV